MKKSTLEEHTLLREEAQLSADALRKTLIDSRSQSYLWRFTVSALFLLLAMTGTLLYFNVLFIPQSSLLIGGAGWLNVAVLIVLCRGVICGAPLLTLVSLLSAKIFLFVGLILLLTEHTFEGIFLIPILIAAGLSGIER